MCSIAMRHYSSRVHAFTVNKGVGRSYHIPSEQLDGASNGIDPHICMLAQIGVRTMQVAEKLLCTYLCTGKSCTCVYGSPDMNLPALDGEADSRISPTLHRHLPSAFTHQQPQNL